MRGDRCPRRRLLCDRPAVRAGAISRTAARDDEVGRGGGQGSRGGRAGGGGHGSSLGGGCLGDGGLSLDRATQTLLVGATADAVGLLLLDAGGVALYADPERQAQIERFLVGEAELTS